jgi:hypothetical protein
MAVPSMGQLISGRLGVKKGSNIGPKSNTTSKKNETTFSSGKC